MKFGNNFDDNILFLDWSVFLTCFESRSNIPSFVQFSLKNCEGNAPFAQIPQRQGKVFCEGTSGGACGYNDVWKGVSNY